VPVTRVTNHISGKQENKMVNNIDELTDDAQSIFDSGNYDEAIKYYDKLIRLDPNNINHYFQKNNCLIHLNRDEESLYLLDKMVKTFPSNENAKFKMLNHVSSFLNYGHSITFLEKAISQYPEKRNFYLVLREQCIKSERDHQKVEKSGCFIATACYGDYDCVEVLTFRNFRDEYLSRTIAGRLFIKVYYAISPSIAEWLKYRKNITSLIRKNILDKIYILLKNKYP
jgi:tetratricopeptide (TPR) repeat protein